MTQENDIRAYLADMADRGDNQAANLLSALDSESMDNGAIECVIQWGEGNQNDKRIEIYKFDTEEEKQAFLKGIEQSNGWLAFDIIEQPMQTFTAFCMQNNGDGTIWIDSVMAIDKESAKIQAILDCAADWAHDPDSINCIGLAAGNIDILDWTL